jgi:hypothetical protein
MCANFGKRCVPEIFEPQQRHSMISDLLIFLLQIYFILMNVTGTSFPSPLSLSSRIYFSLVERCYCEGPFRDNDDRFLIQETIDFCQENNRLFLLRPDWMVQATCISAYGLIFGYSLTLIAVVTKSWRMLAVPLLIFIGIKLNAIFFYHFMEFTSTTPPENLIPYFSVEGPYILSMVLVIVKIVKSLSNANNGNGIKLTKKS